MSIVCNYSMEGMISVPHVQVTVINGVGVLSLLSLVVNGGSLLDRLTLQQRKLLLLFTRSRM